MLLPQHGAEPPAGLCEGRHVVRPAEQQTGRHLGGGPRVNHRGYTGCGGSHRTGDVGPRLECQIPTAGAARAGAAGDTDTAVAVVGPACNDAGDVAGATDGATAAGGNTAFIPAGDRQSPRRPRPPGQRTIATGADACKDKGVPSGAHHGTVNRPRNLQPAYPCSANL